MLSVNLIIKFGSGIVVKVTENMLTFRSPRNLDNSSIESKLDDYTALNMQDQLIASRQPPELPSLSLTKSEPSLEIDFLHLEINVCGLDVKVKY